MSKLNPKINYGAALKKMQTTFPANPMQLSIIQDKLIDLAGYDMITASVRNSALNNKTNDAIKLVQSTKERNPNLAVRLFGAELLDEIESYLNDGKNQNDIPNDMFCVSVLFGYLGDN